MIEYSSDFISATIAVVLFAGCIVANIAIIVMCLKRKVFKDTCQARVVIMHTAFVDLFCSLDCLASSIGYIDGRLIESNRYVCEFEAFREGVAKSQCHNSFLVLAVHRYLLVSSRINARSVISKKLVRIILFSTWAFSLLISVVLKLIGSVGRYNTYFGSCFLEIGMHFGVFLFSLRLISFVAILVLYIRAYCIYVNISFVSDQLEEAKTADKVKLKKMSTEKAKPDENCQTSQQPLPMPLPTTLASPSTFCPLKTISEEKIQTVFSPSQVSVNDLRKVCGNETPEQVGPQGPSPDYCSLKECVQEKRPNQVYSTDSCMEFSADPCYPTVAEVVFQNEGHHLEKIEDESVTERNTVSPPRQEINSCGSNAEMPSIKRRNRQRSNLRNDRFCKAVLVITLYYFLSSTPSMVLMAYRDLPLAVDAILVLKRVSLLLYYSNYGLNAVVFAIIKKEFREEFKKLFTFW